MFIDYRTWKKEKSESFDPDQQVRCPSCWGSAVEECACCGSEVDCRRCDGEGQLPFADLTQSERETLVTPAEYRKALLDDAIAYGDWTGQDPIELLYLDGFEPWQDLQHKEIQINI